MKKYAWSCCTTKLSIKNGNEIIPIYKAPDASLSFIFSDVSVNSGARLPNRLYMLVMMR